MGLALSASAQSCLLSVVSLKSGIGAQPWGGLLHILPSVRFCGARLVAFGPSDIGLRPSEPSFSDAEVVVQVEPPIDDRPRFRLDFDEIAARGAIGAEAAIGRQVVLRIGLE